MCVSRTRGDQPLDTMGHSGATKHTTECSLSNTMPLQKRKEGAPWCTCSLPQLTPVRSTRVRVRVIYKLGLGLGSGLGLGLGLLKKKQKSELRVSRRCIEVERD